MPEPQPVLDASETIQFNEARRLCHLPHDGTKPIKMLHVSLLPQAIDMPHGRQETNTLLFSGPVTKAGWDVSPRFVVIRPRSCHALSIGHRPWASSAASHTA
jgi:hypothetical protein